LFSSFLKKYVILKISKLEPDRLDGRRSGRLVADQGVGLIHGIAPH
jgi:hypothetical protein